MEDGIEGYIKASDISKERVNDAREALQVGQEVEAKIISLDRKSRSVKLSIKAKDSQEEAEAIENYSRQSTDSQMATTLGDLFKEQMESKDKD